MIKPTVGLQDLRKKMYQKGKTEKAWRFWGLYVHICKEETLQEAYRMAKKNNGAPGIDGVTFEAIEERALEEFLGQIRNGVSLWRVSADAESKERDSQRQREGKGFGYTEHKGQSGARSLKTHTGADFRGRLSRRVVWIPTGKDSA